MGYCASYFCHSEDGLLAATAFWISFQQANVFSGWRCIKCLYTDDIPICFFPLAFEIAFTRHPFLSFACARVLFFFSSCCFNDPCALAASPL